MPLQQTPLVPRDGSNVMGTFSAHLPRCSQVFLKDPVPVSLLCRVQVRDIPDDTTTSQAAQGCQPTPPTSPVHSRQSAGSPGIVVAAGRSYSPQRRLSNTAGYLWSRSLVFVRQPSGPAAACTCYRVHLENYIAQS